ncbi:MAG: ABC transporter ATP-binding protein [Rhodospirillales bacterium]|nr:ABC transporter ATP-binding protein [Rhodospirillales bacterium]
MSAGLEARDLRAGYGETVVLEGVSLALAPGGTLAVLGRNGVGKSTLLGTLMGRTTRHGGTVWLNGADISALPAFRRNRKGIALVPQEREIFRSLSVQENLDVAARAGSWSAERVYALFPRLAERRGNRGTQLSGGEQQMLAIGRALMGNPAYLLLDEPLEGLAPVVADAVLAGIDRLRREGGMGIVLVEQHARAALDFAETALVLDRGRTRYAGPSAGLRDQAALARAMGMTREA